jgi:hypothetical protein
VADGFIDSADGFIDTVDGFSRSVQVVRSFDDDKVWQERALPAPATVSFAPLQQNASSA